MKEAMAGSTADFHYRLTFAALLMAARVCPPAERLEQALVSNRSATPSGSPLRGEQQRRWGRPKSGQVKVHVGPAFACCGLFMYSHSVLYLSH